MARRKTPPSAPDATHDAEPVKPIAPWEILCLAAMLALYLAALVWLNWRTGVTVDEPAHLLSSYLYWQGQDKLEPRDMPPAIKIVSGWVPHLTSLPVPYNHSSWRTNQEWHVAGEMMERMTGPESHRKFFLARLPMLIFPILCVLLLWWWGRQWLAPAAALLCVAAYMLEPTAMGHSVLVKNDIAATLAYLFFWYRAWRFWRDPTLANAAWLGAGILAGMLAKMSLLILTGLGPAILLLRFFCVRPWRIRIAAASLIVVLLIPYAGAIVAWQFETQRLSGRTLELYTSDERIPAPIQWGARVFQFLPVVKPLWTGAVSLLHSNADDNAVYMLGKLHANGSLLYFPLAIAVKAPVASQLMILAGILLTFAALRRQPRLLFWLLPPLIYAGLASFSRLQLGIRLILPALPFAILMAGLVLERLWQRRLRVAAMALPAAMAVETALVYPHCISFFNAWVGGPRNGLYYLSDSNIDWGQDLWALPQTLRDLGIPKSRISYFGMNNVWSWFREGEFELIIPPWDEHWARGQVYQPEPGVYAISASLITGQLFQEKYRDYYKVFRGLKPIGTCGYSIYIYRIPEKPGL